MNKSGKIDCMSGEIGIARMAMIFIGEGVPPAPHKSLAHRIIWQWGSIPKTVVQGTMISFGPEPMVSAYLDPRRYSPQAVVGLAERWARLGSFEERMDDLLDDLHAVADRHLTSRVVRGLEQLYGGVGPVEAAKAIGVSETKLVRMFKSELGAPPKRWSMWMRLRRSLDDVISGQSLTEVAHENGFADSAHFSRECKRNFGVSPTHLAGLKVYQTVSPGSCRS